MCIAHFVLLAISLTDVSSIRCMFPLNTTTCPLSNPFTVFQRHGYSAIHIPSNLNWFNPVLLHEESVLHIVNHLKEFKLVGSGGNARVFQGQMRETSKTVIVKTLTNGGFEDLLHEARILAYLQDTGRVPRMLGFLASGPEIDDISMVAEFIENSTSVEDLLHNGALISQCDWLEIAMQTTDSLVDIHAKHVLYNDLHVNNVIISWAGSVPRVYLIDFGHATFRKGKCYTGENISSRETFDFLSPEVWYDVSTPASDIYSLGKTFLEISKHINKSEFTRIAEQCLSFCPEDRPNLEDIKEKLGTICRLSCANENVDTLESGVLNETKVNSNSRDQITKTLQDEMVNIYLPIIPWEALKIIKFENEFVWLRNSEETQIALAYYGDIHATVAIKMFQNATFNEIRHEAAANYVMNETGYVPSLYGLTSAGRRLEDMSLVQEYFANGQTLDDLMDDVRAMNFDNKLALGLEISDALSHFHQKGFIVNNFKTDNILIEFTDNYPVIKVIDIGKCSLQQGYRFDQSESTFQKAEYISPESKHNMMTSYASDVYGLGVILQHVFGPCEDANISELISLCMNEKPMLRPSAYAVAVTLYNVIVRRYDHGVASPLWQDIQSQGFGDKIL